MKEKTIREIISENIKRLIKEAGLKQKDFAKKVDVSNSSVSKYKRGENFFPLEKVPIVVEVLNCTVNDLFSPLFDKFIDDEELSLLVNRLKEIRRNPEVKETMKQFIDIVHTYLEGTIPPEEGDAKQRANG